MCCALMNNSRFKIDQFRDGTEPGAVHHRKPIALASYQRINLIHFMFVSSEIVSDLSCMKALINSLKLDLSLTIWEKYYL